MASESRRPMWTYYAYRVTTSLGFYVPVSVIYLLDTGFGLEFVALAQAVFSFSLLAAEVPTGYLGDRIGRRATLALGNACRVVALLGYVVADAGVSFLALKVVLGTGWALRSGTTDAWLYELLESHGDVDEYARVEGRGSTALLLTSSATAVAGGVLYGVDAALPFLVNAGLAALGIPVLYAAPPATDGATDPDAGATDDAFTVGDAVRTLRLQVRRPEIRWFVAYTVLGFVVFDLSRTFEQPSLDAVGVPVAGMGLLYAGFKLVTAGAAWSAGWFQERLGARGTLGLLAPVLGVAYATLWVVPAGVVPVFFLYRSLRAVVRPIRNQYLNDRLADVGRATVLSGASMVLSLVGGLARIGGGPIAASTGPVRFLAGAGVAVAGVAVVLWLVASPVRDAGAAAAPGNAQAAD